MSDLTTAIAEATTVKHKARALLRDIEALLSGKGLTEEQTAPLKTLADRLKAKWSDLTAPEPTAESVTAEAAAILAQDDSYDGRRGAVQAALMATTSGTGGMMGDGPYPWIRDLYDDVVVFQVEDALFRCDYAIGADDAVTLGDPTEVEVAYTPVADAMQEAEPEPEPEAIEAASDVEVVGDLVPLLEKAVKRDGTISIRLIRPGWGSSGYYSTDVLKRDGPRIFTRGTHSFWNHQTAEESAARPEGDLRDLAAVLTSDAEWRDNGPAGPGLYADAKAIGPYRQAIEDLAPHIGMSIRALGRARTGEAEGRTGPIIEELTDGHSVDFVTRAGAGGEILSLFEAARGRTSPTPGGTAVDEQAERALRESLAAAETQNQALRETNGGYESRLQEQAQQIQRMQEALILRDVKDELGATLRSMDMPDMTRDRLYESLQSRAPIKEGALDKAAFETLIREEVKRELVYLASATGVGDGRIRGMGATDAASDTSAATDALAESLAALGGYSPELARVAANGRR